MLLLAPWSIVWERNVLVEFLPFWRELVRLHAVRGAVSGVGLLSLGLAAWESWVLLAAAVRRRRLPPAAGVERALAEEAGSWSRKG